MVYLDTNVAVALFVPEPVSERVTEWFAACADPVVAGDWIVTELASALSIKERRGELRGEDARAVWSEFEVLSASGLRLMPIGRPAYARAARMVRDATSGLRAGDSLHLAVALEVGASCIATADATLEANARANGLATLRF